MYFLTLTYPRVIHSTVLSGPNCRAPNGQVISADHEVQIDRETTCTCAGNGFMSIGQATCVKTAQPVS